MTTSAQVDPVAIVHQAANADLSTMAKIAGAVLGWQLAAYGVGVHDMLEIRRWASGETEHIADAGVERRLCRAYAICVLLTEIGEAPETIQSWSMGMNPVLYDRAPIEVLREGDLEKVWSAALDWAGGA